MAKYIVMASFCHVSATLHVEAETGAEAFAAFDAAFTTEQRKGLLPIRAINTELFPHMAPHYKENGYKYYSDGSELPRLY